MSRLGSFGARLYHGEASIDFVHRRRLWYALSAVVLLISALGLGLRGLDLGVEFKGGAVFQARGGNVSVAEIRETVAGQGVKDPIAQKLSNGNLRVETTQISTEKAQQIQEAIATRVGVPVDEVQTDVVGPAWGADVTKKALYSLAVFLAVVILYLSLTFDWKMAAAAILALLHDLAITVGVYALIGFTVTPASVIGLLTILGYSLYDTVVVFDKVNENTRGLAGSSRMSYSQAANLAVNQTLVRSINTSLIALLPVAGILFVGAGLLGAGTLKDLSLALFVGIAAGTYSSIFIATPFLAQLKEREPQMQALARRVGSRQSGGTRPAKATVGAVAGSARASAAGGTDGSEAAAAGAAIESAAADGAGPARSGPARSGQAGQGSRQQPKRPQNRSKRKPTGKKRR
jgi:preprotein translocase subunit SecF